MSINDRRGGTDRRTSNRYTVSIDVEWEVRGVRVPGTVSDVSFDGCFVLGPGEVTDGEAVQIFVPLADGMKVQFTGRVANSVEEIGFGVKFDPLSAPQRDLLVTLVRSTEAQ